MNLAKETWDKQDLEEFDNYLNSLSKGEEKAIWEQKIVNTPLPCIAVSSVEVDRIAKEICKGNYISYLDNWLWQNHTHTLIIAKILNRIKDINIYFKYLDKYINCCDNWSSTDTLKYRINENNKNLFLNKTKEYIASDKPFVRRVGLLILMKGFVDEEHLDLIFESLESLGEEEHYYVLMMCSWLISECVIKVKERTLDYLPTSKLPKFAINKAISKCRDSYRLSKEEKDDLSKYKRK